MQDVTGLDRVEFTDKFDLGQTKHSIPNPRKTVNFLDQFDDSGTIDESDTWNNNEFMVPKKRSLRTRKRTLIYCS